MIISGMTVAMNQEQSTIHLVMRDWRLFPEGSVWGGVGGGRGGGGWVGKKQTKQFAKSRTNAGIAHAF